MSLAQFESTRPAASIDAVDELAEPTQLPETVAPGELPELPLDFFINTALGVHPRIRAAQARAAAATNRAPQARALEDPVVSNSFYPISNQGLQTAAGRAGNTLAVSQRYPWPDKRWTKGAIADREAQIALARVAQVQLEIEEMVRLAYYDLWFAHQALIITEQNRVVAVELVKLAEARNAAGGSRRDVLRARLQVDELDDRLVGLRRQKDQARADLAALVEEPYLNDFLPMAALPIDGAPERVDDLFAQAEQLSPRLREIRWAVARDRQKQRLASLNRYPDFTLGAGWQTITESAAVSPVANGHDNVNFMVGVTLPIWRDKIRASIREASADIAASSRDLRAAEDDVYRQISRLVDEALAGSEQLALYEERTLPRAHQALQLTAADYRGQLADFGEVVDGFTEVLMLELQVARTKASIAGALAQLRRVVGCEAGGPCMIP